MNHDSDKPYKLPDWPEETEKPAETPRPRRRKRHVPEEPSDFWGKLRFRTGKKLRWFGRRSRRVIREAKAQRFPESNRPPLQFLLMLWVGNPLPALCVGIVGALVGLFSAFMPPLASYFVPFGYYIPLSAYEVANWDKATHTVTYGTRPFNWGLLAFTLALGAVLFALAWRKVQDEEV